MGPGARKPVVWGVAYKTGADQPAHPAQSNQRFFLFALKDYNQ